jgi:hypothetical protein
MHAAIGIAVKRLLLDVRKATAVEIPTDFDSSMPSLDSMAFAQPDNNLASPLEL